MLRPGGRKSNHTWAVYCSRLSVGLFVRPGGQVYTPSQNVYNGQRPANWSQIMASSAVVWDMSRVDHAQIKIARSDSVNKGLIPPYQISQWDYEKNQLIIKSRRKLPHIHFCRFSKVIFSGKILHDITRMLPLGLNSRQAANENSRMASIKIEVVIYVNSNILS